MLLLSLVLGTLVSEDLTCIAAGLLIQRGEVGALPAVLACAGGILAGDVALWAIGRLCVRPVLAWPWIARHAPADFLERLREWLSRHAASAIVASRFLPGTRLPLYVIAGVVRIPATVFTFWALVGAALWTPPLVLLSVGLDRALVPSMPVQSPSDWLAALAPAAAVLLILHFARRGTLRPVAPARPTHSPAE